MEITEKRIGAICCRLYGEPSASALLLQATDESEAETVASEAALLYDRLREPFLLAAVPVADWNRDLSPWPAPPVFGKAGFGGGAEKTLAAVTAVADALKAERPSLRRTYLGGYSLAGLFALWAAYETDVFDGVAAVSPSVWFPGWTDYARQRPIRTRRVYLSLGDREEKTKNRVMATVGENLRLQYALLENRADRVLEWNAGNHFTEPDLRTAKGFLWLLDRDLSGEGNACGRQEKQRISGEEQ